MAAPLPVPSRAATDHEPRIKALTV